ncbi:ubiquitin C-terminal hydrolase-like protein [Pyronema domesticum]|uniref:Ubiquitin carboxyl-terminal hydrolase n=1 Tax=Pyronema omphalodes (strain CBS 100304) TaxID=1076935 RepID=U4L0Z2_PYROM|nr:ubiquitin C-terminal hydrolase-like protein [Pyronema domesticum]CCX08485.1 Similar to Ubiquitin carboxyl-terminal hydrolase 6; acc. no. Q949Y0 [Pyronema omphalodes CBS 100304]
MSDTEIPILVKHGKNEHEVTVDVTAPVEILKAMLYSLTDVEPVNQKIICKGKTVKDDSDLSTFGLKAGAKVILMGTPSARALQAPKEKMKFVEDMSDAQLAKVEGATPSGLQNLGNTCYLNSTIQALRYIPELQVELKNHNASANPLDPFGAGGSAGSSSVLSILREPDLTGALRDLYKQMGSTTSDFSPYMFLEALRRTYPQFAQKGKDGRYSQQDAEECYSQIMHALRQKLKTKKNGQEVSFIEKYMTGRLSSSLACTEDAPDEMPIETTEDFVNLKCHITQQTNFLKDGILAGLSEKIEKHSPSLGRDAVYEKTSKITRLPKYLTCHFVRFFWRRDINKKTKIMRKVTFPFELDATEYCTDELRNKLIPVRDKLRDLHKDASDRERARKRMKMSTGGAPDDVAGGNAGSSGFGSGKQSETDLVAQDKKKQEEEAMAKYIEKVPVWADELKDKLNPEIMADEGCNPSGLYELFAVVTHQGAGADSGHYCAYVKKEGGDGKTWYYFNDDSVTEVDQQKIETLYGGGESHSALIVLYRALSLEQPAEDKATAA